MHFAARIERAKLRRMDGFSRLGWSLALGLTVSCGATSTSPPSTIASYLGQPVPGTTPVRFAPGIVSRDSIELNGVFRADGREFAFARFVDGVPKIFHATRDANDWSEPRPLPLFPGAPESVAVDMAFTGDGRSMYLLGKHPHPAAGDHRGADIWVSHRVEGRWSRAELVPAPVSTSAKEIYPVVVGDGSLYFISDRPGGLGPMDLYRAQRRDDGRFAEPVNVGAPINGEFGIGDTFVSADESYMIFSSKRPGGQGSGDLFVSFRGADRRWEAPVNLGEGINTQAYEFCPMVTPDGRFLFFTRREGATWAETTSSDIYWVDANILETFRATQ